MLIGCMHSLGKMASGQSVGLDSFLYLTIYLIIFILLLLFGKYLWNDILVKLVQGVKPVSTVWQIFGLHILFSLLFGR